MNFASAAYHLDPDLVNSVIHAESGFNAHAISPKGARGLMQLMPGTGNKLGVNDAFDPQANVTGGSRYLRELLERYNFDLVKALAAYNAGPRARRSVSGSAAISRNPRIRSPHRARVQHEEDRPGKTGETGERSQPKTGCCGRSSPGEIIEESPQQSYSRKESTGHRPVQHETRGHGHHRRIRALIVIKFVIRALTLSCHSFTFKWGRANHQSAFRRLRMLSKE